MSFPISPIQNICLNCGHLLLGCKRREVTRVESLSQQGTTTRRTKYCRHTTRGTNSSTFLPDVIWMSSPRQCLGRHCWKSFLLRLINGGIGSLLFNCFVPSMSYSKLPGWVSGRHRSCNFLMRESFRRSFTKASVKRDMAISGTIPSSVYSKRIFF